MTSITYRKLSASLFALIIAGCAVDPERLTPVELASSASDNLSRVTANQEPISGSIDLYEAMARALKYNLDHKVEALRSDDAIGIR